MKPSPVFFLVLSIVSASRGDVLLPPWTARGDVPVPTWVRSVVPKKAETTIVAAPGRLDLPRATSLADSRLPIYGAVHGPQCGGRWLHVGLESWVCSDFVALSADPPEADSVSIASDGLPYRYYFVGKNGASGYASLDRAGDEAPDEQLDPGFAVATVQERTTEGERWVLTRHGTWIAASEVGAAQPSSFHGEDVGASGLDFAWVRARTSVYSAQSLKGRPSRAESRRQVVRILETHDQAVRVAHRDVCAVPPCGGSGDSAAEWIDARALIRPTLAPPPPEVRGETERWIDVELATQTLVAYEGPRPVFATLVSTGAPGAETATHKGTFRIWVKLLSSTMDNIVSSKNDDANEDAHPAAEGARYSMEDVPYVQFFDKGIAFHGVFWHDDFGHVHSHGCVNLAPRDAARLFAFTSPHLTAGLSAILPSHIEPGTVVRVR